MNVTSAPKGLLGAKLRKTYAAVTLSLTVQEKVIISVYVQPRASKNEIVGPHGDAIKVRLTAPPVDGAANEALILFLAKEAQIPRSAVRIIAGETSRRKTVEITTDNAQAVHERLGSGK